MKIDITNLTDFLKTKQVVFNYNYKYWSGDESHMFLNKDIQEKFGNSREGFENFKNESLSSENVNISHSGYVSLRTITNKKDNKIIGYVSEEKVRNNSHYKEAENIYNSHFKQFIKLLNVQDEESLNYYLDSKYIDFSFVPNLNSYLQKSEQLNIILNDYEYDEEFQKFFDKIIKK